MRVDYILATHLQCKPRSDRVKAALAEGLVTLRDADGGEHTIRDGTFQIVVGAETLSCDGTALPRPFQRLLAVHKEADGSVELSLIHISEPTRPRLISYAVFCLKKKNDCYTNGQCRIILRHNRYRYGN